MSTLDYEITGGEGSSTGLWIGIGLSALSVVAMVIGIILLIASVFTKAVSADTGFGVFVLGIFGLVFGIIIATHNIKPKAE